MKIAGARPSSNDIKSIFNFAEVLRFYILGIAETGLYIKSTRLLYIKSPFKNSRWFFLGGGGRGVYSTSIASL